MSQENVYRGTCLYLGPAGQRCLRPAREDGFCNRHATETDTAAWARFLRVIGAALLLAALVWPLLADLVREIGRWLR